MADIRAFRNTDPPGLIEIWNGALTRRGAAKLRKTSLEHYVFAKPYFDPDGLLVALENGAPVGFAHAGFGPASTEKAIERANGVLCAIAVNPSHQRQGVGAALLEQCENYLTRKGSLTIYAGPMWPFNPFYCGLYGGSESPGFLESDPAAGSFLAKHGYQPVETCLVYKRRIGHQPAPADGRFPGLRRRYEVAAVPRTGPGSWWRECVLGPVDLIEFRLQESATGHVVARVAAWEMEAYAERWGEPGVGLVELEVRQDLRRQGLAKFLLCQVFRYLQEQCFNLVEIQTMQQNAVAVKLFRSLGFEQVDVGRSYRKGP